MYILLRKAVESATSASLLSFSTVED